LHPSPAGLIFEVSKRNVAVTQILIRNLDEGAAQRLRELASSHGVSIEAAARAIIERALNAKTMPKESKKFGTMIREIFEPLGGVDLPDMRDRTPHKPISFDE
jgi:plasmid stability protein